MSEGVLGKLYADGELIVRQGEVGNCMYVVQSGKLEVLREEHDGIVRIGIMEVGEFFGEMSIFEHEVRSASVTTRQCLTSLSPSNSPITV